jgi:hypothetical protein
MNITIYIIIKDREPNREGEKTTIKSKAQCRQTYMQTKPPILIPHTVDSPLFPLECKALLLGLKSEWILRCYTPRQKKRTT